MAGFRDFQTGEILTATNVNDFLMNQSVMVFADSSARDTALGTAVGGSNALLEGMVSYLEDVKDVQVYNGVSWEPIRLYPETSERTTDYTLALTDASKVVPMNAAGTATVTVPTNASVAFPLGAVVGIYNAAGSAVTVEGDSGVTVRNAGEIPQYQEVSLRKRGTDEWVLL